VIWLKCLSLPSGYRKEAAIRGALIGALKV